MSWQKCFVDAKANLAVKMVVRWARTTVQQLALLQCNTHTGILQVLHGLPTPLTGSSVGFPAPPSHLSGWLPEESEEGRNWHPWNSCVGTALNWAESPNHSSCPSLPSSLSFSPHPSTTSQLAEYGVVFLYGWKYEFYLKIGKTRENCCATFKCTLGGQGNHVCVPLHNIYFEAALFYILLLLFQMCI